MKTYWRNTAESHRRISVAAPSLHLNPDGVEILGRGESVPLYLDRGKL